MKIKSLLILLLLFIQLQNGWSQGQREYSGLFDTYYYKGIQNLSFTVGGGMTNYFGDLNSMPGYFSSGFGVGVNYKLWPHILFGAEFHYLSLKGKDGAGERNLQFSSTNMEFLGFGRFYFIDDIVRISRDRDSKSRFLKTYMVAGFGMLSYKPTTTYFAPPADSSYLDEGKSYPKTALVIPVGLGLAWRISNRVSLLTEYTYRLAFTDYLDDVSIRGNSSKNDGYGVLDIKLQIFPFVKAKKKAKTLAPPPKYEGPKGTDTWKNRKKEEPVERKDYQEEETPTEEPNPEETPNEEQLEEETPEETPEEEPEIK